MASVPAPDRPSRCAVAVGDPVRVQCPRIRCGHDGGHSRGQDAGILHSDSLRPRFRRPCAASRSRLEVSAARNLRFRIFRWRRGSHAHPAQRDDRGLFLRVCPDDPDRRRAPGNGMAAAGDRFRSNALRAGA